MTRRATPLEKAAGPKRLAIFDYGAGNLHSLVKAISADERDITIETDIRAATRADVLLLPGVGAFGAAAGAMRGQQSYIRSALAIPMQMGIEVLYY